MSEDENRSHDPLKHLNPAQRAAVEHIEGPLLILAGPGSGKTRVVTHRVVHLMRAGVRPGQILALTFTNKAAEEMRQRIQSMAPGALVRASTFHRFCARQLRELAPLIGLSENYSIYDSDDSRRLLKRVLEPFMDAFRHYTPERIGQAISWAKNHCILPDEYEPKPGHPLGSVVKKVYPLYQQALLQANAADFDDLLLHFCVLLRENEEVRTQLSIRNRFILVDEYQDTNTVQYAIVRQLSVAHGNLAATGDPDQSIYSWRGASIQNILDFEKDFPGAKVVRLEQNYRSTKAILRAADSLIKHNRNRKEKRLFTENAEGEPVRLRALPTQRDEAEYIVDHIAHAVRTGGRRYRDHAIFYRTNALSRTLEIALREHGIPFQIVHGVEFFQRAEIKDVLAYLRLINNPRDDEAFIRIVNTPARGIGKSTLEKLRSAAFARRLPLPLAIARKDCLEGLSKRASNSLAEFARLLECWRQHSSGSVKKLLEQVLNDSGYLKMVSENDEQDEEGRADNVRELLTVASSYDERKPDGGLLGFLEETALVGDTDDWEQEPDFVTLMTLHASKGLEFPVVFVVAIEQGLLPHERSQENEVQLEEERRLFFVGMTRAREELHLLYTELRDFRGQRRFAVPSQFLMELPRAEMSVQAPRMWSDPLAGLSFDPKRLPTEFADPPDELGDDAEYGSDGRHQESSLDESFDPASFDPASFDPTAFDKRAQPMESSQAKAGAIRLTDSGDAADGQLTQGKAMANAKALKLATAAQLLQRYNEGGEGSSFSGSPTNDAPNRPGVNATIPPVADVNIPQGARLTPDEFYEGLVVRHAEYGPGKVISVSGGGARRSATIVFPTLGEEKRFILQHSVLLRVEK